MQSEAKRQTKKKEKKHDSSPRPTAGKKKTFKQERGVRTRNPLGGGGVATNMT